MRSVYLSLMLIGLLVVWSASNIMWGKHHVGIIKADGKGYYAHLPAVFIYDDLNFGFYDSVENGTYYNENYAYEYRKNTEGKAFNKYYCGTAVPMMPFFLGAHLYALNSEYPADGYSKPYNISISLAAMAYLLATLWLFVGILRRFKISNTVIAWCLPIIVFGTNWYYYVISEPAVSHVYSVFFITLFVHLGLKWAQTKKPPIIAMGALIGLIILIRPVNGLVILLTPFFFPDFKAFRLAITNVFKDFKRLFVGLLAGLAIVSIQLIVYKIQTGHFLIYSYEEEGFNFLKPEILNILFSYKKGLFVYTPILLITLVGLFPWMREKAWRPMGLFLFLAVLTYVLSSWWNWYYGGSFSSRVYLDYMLLFTLPLAKLAESLSPKWQRSALWGVLLALVLFCQFQTYQYRKMVIHWDGMTKETYWDAFLNFDSIK